MKASLILISFFFLSLSGYSQIITTIAGTGTAGYSGDGGPAVDAELQNPAAVAIDKYGNVYIADRENNCVRKITAGIITTIAGTGVAGFSGDGGPATAAQLYQPSGLAIDKKGNIYVSEEWNNCVRKINTSGIISTYAGIGTVGGYSGDGGPATMAKLVTPFALAIDNIGNLFITQLANSVVRKVSATGIITTVAGNGASVTGIDGGLATNSTLNAPLGVAVDTLGNIFIMDDNSHRVRKVNASGYISTIAGTGANGFTGDNGPATDAELSLLWGINIDNWNNLYFCDAANDRIRKISQNGIITTIAGGGSMGLGDGLPAVSCQLNNPASVAIDGNGNIYIADFANHRIRYVTTTVSVDQQNNYFNELELFPNPFSQYAILRFDNKDRQNCKLTVFNAQGQVVQQKDDITSDRIRIDRTDLPSGFYYYQLRNSNNIVANGKFIIR